MLTVEVAGRITVPGAIAPGEVLGMLWSLQSLMTRDRLLHSPTKIKLHREAIFKSSDCHY